MAKLTSLINTLLTICFIAFGFTSYAQTGCKTAESMKRLDLQWENALLSNDSEFLEDLVANKFLWVHNHASLFDTKEAVVNRAIRGKAKGTSNTRSRTSSDVQVIVSNGTAIVSGFTMVDRGPSPVRYHFMRTYVSTKGKCKLLSNHTMAVPQE